MTHVNTILIWAPRFSRKDVLIAHYRVQSGRNRIVFTHTMRDKVLFMDGAKIKSYPMESNGSIGCYAVPLRDFETENSLQRALL